VDRHIDSFLRHLDRRGLSPNTIKAYRRDLEQFSQISGITNPREVTVVAIRAFLADLLSRGVSKRSLARKLSTLRAFFKYLVDSGELESSPADSLRTPRFDRRLPGFLDVTQAKQMVEAPAGESKKLSRRDTAVLELLYSSGMRVSELVSLDMDEIDLRSCVVRIIGKGSKERLVPVGSYARAALERYMRSRSAKPGEQALFVNRFCIEIRRAAWTGGKSIASHNATQLRDAHARCRLRPSHPAGDAGAFEPLNHADLHARHNPAHAGSLREGTPSREVTASFEIPSGV
jgi:integrase/recombinase XerC